MRTDLFEFALPEDRIALRPVRRQLVDHLGNRMDAADLERRFAYRQGDIDGFGVEALFNFRLL